MRRSRRFPPLAELVRVWRFIRRRDVGRLPRWLAVASLVYVLWPFDLLPGMPPLSWLDDAVVVAIVWHALHALTERYDRPPVGGVPPHGRDDESIDTEGYVT